MFSPFTLSKTLVAESYLLQSISIRTSGFIPPGDPYVLNKCFCLYLNGYLRGEVQPERHGVRSRRSLCEGMRRDSGRARHFRLFTSINIRLSSALSLAIFLSWVFSHSSASSRFASLTHMRPNLDFQR